MPKYYFETEVSIKVEVEVTLIETQRVNLSSPTSSPKVSQDVEFRLDRVTTSLLPTLYKYGEDKKLTPMPQVDILPYLEEMEVEKLSEWAFNEAIAQDPSDYLTDHKEPDDYKEF